MVTGDDVKESSVCVQPQLTGKPVMSHIPRSVVLAANTSLAFRVSRNEHKRAVVAVHGRRSPPDKCLSSRSSPIPTPPDLKVKVQNKENSVAMNQSSDNTMESVSPVAARKRKLKHQDVQNSRMEMNDEDTVLKSLIPSPVPDTVNTEPVNTSPTSGVSGTEFIPDPMWTESIAAHNGHHLYVTNSNVIKRNDIHQTLMPNGTRTDIGVSEYRIEAKSPVTDKDDSIPNKTTSHQVNGAHVSLPPQLATTDPLPYSSSRSSTQPVRQTLPGSIKSPFYLPEQSLPTQSESFTEKSCHDRVSQLDGTTNKSDTMSTSCTDHVDTETAMESCVAEPDTSSNLSSLKSDHSSVTEDLRTQSLPPPSQSSYKTIQQHKLPPKKRRLYYEQDLSGSSSDQHRPRSEPSSPRSAAGSPACQSLPANFDPSVKSHYMSFPAPSMKEQQTQDSGYMSWPFQPGLPLSFPPIVAPNAQFLYFPSQIPSPYMNYVPMSVSPSTVQDLSKGMAALLQNPDTQVKPVAVGTPERGTLYTAAPEAVSHINRASQLSVPHLHTTFPSISTSTTAKSMPAILEQDTCQDHGYIPGSVNQESNPEGFCREDTAEKRNSPSPRFVGRGIQNTDIAHVPEKSGSPVGSNSRPRKRDKAKTGRSRKDASKKNLSHSPGNSASPVNISMSPSPPPVSPPATAAIRLDDRESDDRGSPSSEGIERHLAIEPDEDGDLPIHIAVVQDEPAAVQCLIAVMKAENVSIDYHNKLKQTPLHLAVITKLDTVVKMLLDAGASPNIPDRKGQTCCHLAVSNRTTACLEALVQHSKIKADLNAKNYDGLTPLHRAVQLGDTESVTILLKNGADINLVDGKSGKSPLYLSFECNQPKVADLLLAEGADVNIPTYSGSTVLQAANPRGQHLLNHVMGRGEVGSAVRDLQNKLTSKAHRSRQKTTGPLANKNHRQAHVTSDGLRPLLTTPISAGHSNTITTSPGDRLAFARDTKIDNTPKENGNYLVNVTKSGVGVSPRPDGSDKPCQMPTYQLHATKSNIRISDTPMET